MINVTTEFKEKALKKEKKVDWACLKRSCNDC